MASNKEFTFTLTDEEATQLRVALTDLPLNKKIFSSGIVSKLVGSGSIWPNGGLNEIVGILPTSGFKSSRVFKQSSPVVGKNFIVANDFAKDTDRPFFFEDEEVNTLTVDNDMLDVLVIAKIFSSRGQAKKNGWAGKEVIPNGWTEFTVGKKKHQIFIWNPNE